MRSFLFVLIRANHKFVILNLDWVENMMLRAAKTSMSFYAPHMAEYTRAFQNKNFSHVSFWEGEILGLQARLSSTRRTPWNDALIRLKVRVQRLSETMP
jgi:hypothetical protein